MGTSAFEKRKEQILFEVFSAFRYFVLGEKKMPRTERLEKALFERWEMEHTEAIEALPWKAIIRIHTDPPGIALLADKKRQDLVFSIVKTIRDAKNGP